MIKYNIIAEDANTGERHETEGKCGVDKDAIQLFEDYEEELGKELIGECKMDLKSYTYKSFVEDLKKMIQIILRGDDTNIIYTITPFRYNNGPLMISLEEDAYCHKPILFNNFFKYKFIKDKTIEESWDMMSLNNIDHFNL